MMQGVLVPHRVRLLLRAGHSGYRPRRDGERRRKSVRGCIVGADISALNLIVVKKGDGELPGITDKYLPRRLGPKRASKIRKLFNLSKRDNLIPYVRTYAQEKTKEKNGKTVTRYKMPKIQRLVTPATIRNKRKQVKEKIRRIKKSRQEASDYAKLLRQRVKELRARKHSISVRRAESEKRKSEEKKKAEQAAKKKAEQAAKKKAAAKAAKKTAAAEKAAAPKKGAAAAAPKKGAKAPAAPKKGAAKPAAAAAKPAKPAAGAKKAAAAAKPAAAKSAAAEKKPAAAKPAAPKESTPKPAASKAKEAPAAPKQAAPAKAAAKPAAKAAAAAKPAAAKQPAAKKQKQ